MGDDYDKDWRIEKVTVKDSDYAKKLGLSGTCRFMVTKGTIKIVQEEGTTALTLQVPKIRNWGATRSIFYLELGRKVPAGPGKLEFYHDEPNNLRLLVRETVSSKASKSSKTKTDDGKGYQDGQFVVSEYDDYEYDYEQEYYEYGEEEKERESAASSASFTSAYDTLAQDEGEEEKKWFDNVKVKSEESGQSIRIKKTEKDHVRVESTGSVYGIISKNRNRPRTTS